jgi:thymidylate synthase
MKIITSSCPDEALFKGLTLLTNEGLTQSTRAGDALVMPCPVMTVNENPLQRVSFNPRRNANPFFHLMESLWMLAGRNDITWLDQFVGDFSSRFGDSDGAGGLIMHGAYGFRWRKHFDIEGGGDGWPPDQLNEAVRLLKASPDDRQVVITMWDPVADLGASGVKDRPCNTHIYLRVRKEKQGEDYGDGGYWPSVLDLTVCCRSNDAVMGAHGANVVHFSVLQEYLAARMSVGVGKLYQLSNNYHVYKRDLDHIWPLGTVGLDEYSSLLGMAKVLPLVTDPAWFDQDLKHFFHEDWFILRYSNSFFYKVAIPMRRAYALWRATSRTEARDIVHCMVHCDWRVAAEDWFARLMHKQVS